MWSRGTDRTRQLTEPVIISPTPPPRRVHERTGHRYVVRVETAGHPGCLRLGVGHPAAGVGAGGGVACLGWTVEVTRLTRRPDGLWSPPRCGISPGGSLVTCRAAAVLMYDLSLEAHVRTLCSIHFLI